MLSKTFNKRLYDSCSATQQPIYEYYCKYPELSNAKLAAKLNKGKSAVGAILRRIEKRAVLVGVEPAYTTEDGAGVGRRIGKVTTHIKDGETVQEWIRTDTKTVSAFAVAEEICNILQDQTPVRDYVISEPEYVDNDLMSIYPMGDPHLGLYAWAEESGDNFNCDECERRIVTAIDRLVDTQPNSHVGRIHNVGDFFHSDTEDATTRRSGHHLDVDGRWGRVLRIGIRMMTHCIDRCLEKHQNVEVVNAVGNHDDQTAYALSIILAEHYRLEPRVEIDTTYNKFYFREFGANLIGVNHGMLKPEVLYRVMASDRPEAWGRTKYRCWHVGHIHHTQVKEIDGVIVESFRSLKSKDAYETEHGYRAGRDMKAILYHIDHGEIERHTCNITQL